MSDIPQGLAYIVNGLKARGHEVEVKTKTMKGSRGQTLFYQLVYDVPEFHISTQYTASDLEEADRGLWDIRIDTLASDIERLHRKFDETKDLNNG